MDVAVKERKTRVVDIYHTCCVCGKVVYTGMADMKHWAYKKGKSFCCSYSCYCKGNGFKRR